MGPFSVHEFLDVLSLRGRLQLPDAKIPLIFQTDLDTDKLYLSVFFSYLTA